MRQHLSAIAALLSITQVFAACPAYGDNIYLQAHDSSPQNGNYASLVLHPFDNGDYLEFYQNTTSTADVFSVDSSGHLVSYRGNGVTQASASHGPYNRAPIALNFGESGKNITCALQDNDDDTCSLACSATIAILPHHGNVTYSNFYSCLGCAFISNGQRCLQFGGEKTPGAHKKLSCKPTSILVQAADE